MPKHFRVGMKVMQTLYALSNWMLREGVVEQVYNRWGYMTINTHRELNFLWVRSKLDLKTYSNYEKSKSIHFTLLHRWICLWET